MIFNYVYLNKIEIMNNSLEVFYLINDKYTDNDFNVSEVAKELRISKSYLDEIVNSKYRVSTQN